MSLLFLLPLGVQAQDSSDAESQYKVHCDCEHTAGVFEGTREEANAECMRVTAALMQADLGAIGLSCDDNGCTCIFSHSVFAFGSDRDSAIENAESTCSALSQETSKDFAITSPEACKDEQ